MLAVVPAEDAYVQERLLTGPVLERAQHGELWLADCNLSTRAIVGGWAAQGVCFIVRESCVSTASMRTHAVLASEQLDALSLAHALQDAAALVQPT